MTGVAVGLQKRKPARPRCPGGLLGHATPKAWPWKTHVDVGHGSARGDRQPTSAEAVANLIGPLTKAGQQPLKATR